MLGIKSTTLKKKQDIDTKDTTSRLAPYRLEVRKQTPLILRKSYFYDKAVKAAASQLKFLDTPFKKIRYLMKMIDTLRDVNDSETNSQLAYKFIEDTFNKYYEDSKVEIHQTKEPFVGKLIYLTTQLASEEVVSYRHNNKLAPGNKSKIISCMIAIELKKNISSDTINPQEEMTQLVLQTLRENAENLFKAKLNIAHLIDAIKTIIEIDSTALLISIKTELFINPYQTYMQVHQFSTLAEIAITDIKSSKAPNALTLTDGWGALYGFEKKYTLNEYHTFGHGDCGFVASHTPRSFIREFLSNETNMYLYRLFVNNMTAKADPHNIQWKHFHDIYMSDTGYLHETHVATFINLFKNKVAYLVSPSNLNNLINSVQICEAFLPENTSENQYFFRQAGEHFTYCAHPDNDIANKVGRLKALMSSTGNAKRQGTNLGVEKFNFGLPT